MVVICTQIDVIHVYCEHICWITGRQIAIDRCPLAIANLHPPKPPALIGVRRSKPSGHDTEESCAYKMEPVNMRGGISSRVANECPTSPACSRLLAIVNAYAIHGSVQIAVGLLIGPWRDEH